VGDIVRMALEYAGKRRDYPLAPDPHVHVLNPGDKWRVGSIQIETTSSHHAVKGLMYKFITEEGKTLVYSGDTAPNAETVSFAKGVDVLIHEHSWGPWRDEKDANTCGHSSAYDAARIAAEAGVGKLYLVHSDPKNVEACLMEARAVFQNTYRPKPGDLIVL